MPVATAKTNPPLVKSRGFVFMSQIKEAGAFASASSLLNKKCSISSRTQFLYFFIMSCASILKACLIFSACCGLGLLLPAT